MKQKLPDKQLVRDMIDRGWTQSEIARKYGVRRQTVYKFLSTENSKRKIPVDQVNEMREQGMSSTEIAKQLKFTPSAIRAVWRRNKKPQNGESINEGERSSSGDTCDGL